MERLLFVDMDGVLVDLMGGVCAKFGVPMPENPTYDLSEIGIPDVWDYIAGEGARFWEDLPAYPWTQKVVKLAVTYAAEENVYILSKPTVAPGCWAGKVKWVRRVLGEQWVERLILAREKWTLAAPGRLLIDDFDLNIREFQRAGGYGLTFPQPWNEKCWNTMNRMDYLERLLIVD